MASFAACHPPGAAKLCTLPSPPPTSPPPSPSLAAAALTATALPPPEVPELDHLLSLLSGLTRRAVRAADSALLVSHAPTLVQHGCPRCHSSAPYTAIGRDSLSSSSPVRECTSAYGRQDAERGVARRAHAHTRTHDRQRQRVHSETRRHCLACITACLDVCIPGCLLSLADSPAQPRCSSVTE